MTSRETPPDWNWPVRHSARPGITSRLFPEDASRLTCRAGGDQANHARRELRFDSRIGHRFRIAPEDVRFIGVLRRTPSEQCANYRSPQGPETTVVNISNRQRA